MRYSLVTRIGAIDEAPIRVCILLDIRDIMSHKLNERKIFDF
jgi:hypothetical protein